MEAGRKIERDAGLWADEIKPDEKPVESEASRLAREEHKAKRAADLKAYIKRSDEEFPRTVTRIKIPRAGLVAKATREANKGKA